MSRAAVDLPLQHRQTTGIERVLIGVELQYAVTKDFSQKRIGDGTFANAIAACREEIRALGTSAKTCRQRYRSSRYQSEGE